MVGLGRQLYTLHTTLANAILIFVKELKNHTSHIYGEAIPKRNLRLYKFTALHFFAEDLNHFGAKNHTSLPYKGLVFMLIRIRKSA